MNNYMKQRYKKRRSEAITTLGGACSNCGSTADLHIHHKDPSQKSFTLASGSSFSDERWNAEIAKCELLCASCHVDEHRSTAPCGTPQRYWAGCRCELCRSAFREYNSEYRRRRRALREQSRE